MVPAVTIFPKTLLKLYINPKTKWWLQEITLSILDRLVQNARFWQLKEDIPWIYLQSPLANKLECGSTLEVQLPNCTSAASDILEDGPHLGINGWQLPSSLTLGVVGRGGCGFGWYRISGKHREVSSVWIKPKQNCPIKSTYSVIYIHSVLCPLCKLGFLQMQFLYSVRSTL